MDLYTAQCNAEVIYFYPNNIFVLDKDDQINSISSWNILGRLIEWIKDKRSGGSRSAKVSRLVSDTLDKIKEDISQNKNSSFQSDHRDWTGTTTKIAYRTIAKRIQASYLNANPEINQKSKIILNS